MPVTIYIYISISMFFKARLFGYFFYFSFCSWLLPAANSPGGPKRKGETSGAAGGVALGLGGLSERVEALFFVVRLLGGNERARSRWATRVALFFFLFFPKVWERGKEDLANPNDMFCFWKGKALNHQ